MRIVNTLLLLIAVLIFGQSSAQMRPTRLPRLTGIPAPSASRIRLPVSRNASDNLCAAFGWRGYADTGIDFSDFFTRNHTIAARFMIQYARSYQAPILAVNGSDDFLVA